jgi:hypothetical protein
LQRNAAYDGIRGWLLIIIACNHLYGNFVPEITRWPFGFVSAAEGFIFLSGVVAYLVYARYAADVRQLKRKIWRRCLTIYSFHLTAMLLTMLLIWLFPWYIPQWKDFFNAANWFHEPLQSVIAAVLLLEQPGYHDILILYLVPMLFLPFAIIAIKNGKALGVGFASLAVWLLAQFITTTHFEAPFHAVLPAITLNVSYFDPFAWQLYFYLGVLLSYLKTERGYQFKLPLWLQGCLIMKHSFSEFIPNALNNQAEASALHLLNLLLLAYLLMLLMRAFPRLFTFQYAVFLGQHALPVFAFHAVVIYFLQPWSQAYTAEKWYWDVLICLLFIGMLAIPATLDQKWRARQPSALQDSQLQ